VTQRSGSSIVSRVIDRYLNLMEGTLRAALESRRDPPDRDGTVSMARGLGCAERVLNGRLITHGSELPPGVKVIDGAGHSRSMYRGLLAYALQSTLPGAGSQADALLAREHLLAADARDIVGDLWSSLASSRAGDVITHFTSMQRSSGEWFLRTDSDNPEPLWYHELVALHAVASAQARHRNLRVHDAISRSARYIAAEVQPDHASSQPWALHALLTVPDGVHLADMMLHAAGVQQPSTMDAVSLILLTDALDCLRGEDQRK
jgi:hypothetical protein